MTPAPLRILQVNKFHWLKGGSERYYFDLQAELAARGHEVAVFSTKHTLNEATPWEEYFVGEVDYRIGADRAALGLARDVIWNRDAASRLDRLLERFRPDVAHLHNFHHQLSPSILEPLARRGIPVVQTLHDYKWVCPAYLFLSQGRLCERCGPGNRFLPVVMKQCQHDSLLRSLVVYLESSRSWGRRDFERVARFLAPSAFMAERVTTHGLPHDRVIEMPYFVRSAAYRPADVPGADFLYLGRLSREKGLPVLFDALARRKGRFHLRIAGGGPLEAELRARALDEDLPVTFLGHMGGERLHDAIRAARAVIVPSVWYENQPYAILETMALGVPVIGAKIGGIPELVEPGVTGYLAEPGDPGSLLEAMDLVEADPAAAHRMGRAARQRIENDFGARRALDRLEALYRELGGPGQGR